MSSPRRLKAPAEDGGILAEPPLGEVGRLIEENCQRLAAPVDILGRPLADLQQQARSEAAAAARAYLHQSGEPVPSSNHNSLILAGHQPELVHPGVWAKNFALHGLAERHGVTPLNLVVDHDTVKSTSLRLPARVGNAVHLQSVPYDIWTGEEPYEERMVQDEAIFAGFSGFAGGMPDFWSAVLVRPEETRPAKPDTPPVAHAPGSPTPLLGERFARARRAFERRWGCHNLEVPTSRLCQTQAFAWFAAHLLLHIDRFIDIHNTALAEYRRANRVRSKNHPVPELVRDGDWREVPFWGWHWVWRTPSPRRGRLMARQSGGAIELRVGDQAWPTLPAQPAKLVAAWPDLEKQGYKIRFRALTTTLFARLFLGDLFIHGIGGGKYDELTDVIIRRFYGLEPPHYLVLSGTLHLPLPTHLVTAADRGRLIRQVRDLHYHPEQHLANGQAADLVQEKQEWVRREPADAEGRRQRFRKIRELSEQLRPLVAAEELAARQRLADVEAQLRDNVILRRRDFAACLFPETRLRPFLTQFLHG